MGAEIKSERLGKYIRRNRTLESIGHATQDGYVIEDPAEAFYRIMDRCNLSLDLIGCKVKILARADGFLENSYRNFSRKGLMKENLDIKDMTERMKNFEAAQLEAAIVFGKWDLVYKILERN